ncbi:hypothetical protein BGZ49_002609, partial [Haplosporangium sp. Z 27]
MNTPRNDRKTRDEARARRGTDLQVAEPAKENKTGVSIRTQDPLKHTISHTNDKN